MGASKRHKVMSVDGIVAALRPNRTYQASNLARAYGTESKHIRRFLNQAVEAGLVDAVRAHGEICYRLVWSEPLSDKATEAPYRNLRLDEDMHDYEKSLFERANLCMMVRR